MKASSCSLNALLRLLQTAKSHKAKRSQLANSVRFYTDASGTTYLGAEKSLIYFPTHDAVSQNQELHLFVEPEWEESEIVSDERQALFTPDICSAGTGLRQVVAECLEIRGENLQLTGQFFFFSRQWSHVAQHPWPPPHWFGHRCNVFLHM